MERHALRRTARRGGFTSPLQHLFGPVGQVCRTVLIPQYTRGERRKAQPCLRQVRIRMRRARAHGDRRRTGSCASSCAACPADPQDPGYRRLRYCRYADDHLLGFIGPKAEAEEIKARLARSCVTTSCWNSRGQDPDHPRPHRRGTLPRLRDHRPARRPEDHPRTAVGQRHRRVARAAEVIKAKCAPYLRGKPERRTQLLNLDDHHIISTYGAEYRGSSSTTCWPVTSGD